MIGERNAIAGGHPRKSSKVSELADQLIHSLGREFAIPDRDRVYVDGRTRTQLTRLAEPSRKARRPQGPDERFNFREEHVRPPGANHGKIDCAAPEMSSKGFGAIVAETALGDGRPTNIDRPTVHRVGVPQHVVGAFIQPKPVDLDSRVIVAWFPAACWLFPLFRRIGQPGSRPGPRRCPQDRGTLLCPPRPSRNRPSVTRVDRRMPARDRREAEGKLIENQRRNYDSDPEQRTKP